MSSFFNKKLCRLPEIKTSVILQKVTSLICLKTVKSSEVQISTNPRNKFSPQIRMRNKDTFKRTNII